MSSIPASVDGEYAQHELDAAYAVVSGSGVALIKLDVGYGLIGRSDESVKRIYDLKGRSASNPCVVPGSIAVLRALCPTVDAAVLEWVRKEIEWTPLSVIHDLDATSALWRSLPPLARQHCSKDGSVAVFLRPGRFLEALVDRALREEKLLIGSSGNLSGQGNCYRSSDLPMELVRGVDLFVDHGVARYQSRERLATTMIDLRNLQMTRRGVNHAPIEKNLNALRMRVEVA